MTVNSVDTLDDRSVLLAVQYLAEDLQQGEPAVVRSEAEARQVICSLLTQTHVSSTAPEALLPTEPAALAAARRALSALGDDADTREMTAQLLAEPPEDEQMSVEAALASTSVLVLLITWLQTKVELRIRRKGGKTEVDFTIGKQAADARTLREIAMGMRSVLGLPAAPAPPNQEPDQGAPPAP
ncbi:hypothetical protein [Streptomyces sp. NBC_01353]|uniref:hypothetical protein n=1 Tax=Streptomyces sp. NBC_01353 TaxID=2903835 RepID=UPI002E324D91|nr:hypothetical protein [Streptomyces sp. NBC_01353]